MTAFTAAQAEVKSKRERRRDDYRHFLNLCMQANVLLLQASKFAIGAGLAEVDQRRAEAAAALSGAMFHTVNAANPTPDDFGALRDDLDLIASKVDPLIAAIGEEARCNSTEFKDGDFDANFKNVIRGAVEGNADYLLERCADAAREVA